MGCPAEPVDGDFFGPWCEVDTLPCQKNASSLVPSIEAVWPIVGHLYEEGDTAEEFVQHLTDATTNWFYCSDQTTAILPLNCSTVRSYFIDGGCCSDESVVREDVSLIGKPCVEWDDLHYERGCCSGEDLSFSVSV